MQLRHLALALLISTVAAAGMTPGGQQSTQIRPGTATLSGTVRVLSSDQPIGDATVSLYAAQLPGGRITTASGADGRFAFTALPSGRYIAGASKSGFVTVTHGEHYTGRGGRAIVLEDGEVRDIQLKLPHLSVITGSVMDERGRPAANASVRAVRFSSQYLYGYSRPMVMGTTTSDERGAYRIESLQPDDYAVCASTHNTGPLNEAQRLRAEIDRQRKSVEFVLGPAGMRAQMELAPRLAQLESRLPAQIDPLLGYAPVCHPGTASAPSRVRLAAGEQRAGVNLQFALTRLARIEGIVVGLPSLNTEMDPILLANTSAFANTDEALADLRETARPNIEGRFRFTNVAPGRYRLMLRGTADGSQSARLAASMDVVVNGEDITNIVLDPQRGATVTGRLVFDGTGAPSPSDVARISVRMSPAHPATFRDGSSTTPDASGHFTLANVFPGAYRLSASLREPPYWFLESVTFSGRDILDQPLEVKANQSISGVVVTMTDRRAEVSGTIVNDRGEPANEYSILAYPPDEKDWSWPAYRMGAARATGDGRFVIRGLRAGEYRLATLLDPEPGAWMDPAVLRELDSEAIRLSLAAGEKKVQNLRVPSGR